MLLWVPNVGTTSEKFQSIDDAVVLCLFKLLISFPLSASTSALLRRSVRVPVAVPVARLASSINLPPLLNLTIPRLLGFHRLGRTAGPPGPGLGPRPTSCCSRCFPRWGLDHHSSPNCPSRHSRRHSRPEFCLQFPSRAVESRDLGNGFGRDFEKRFQR